MRHVFYFEPCGMWMGSWRDYLCRLGNVAKAAFLIEGSMKPWETVAINVVAWGIFFPAGLFAVVWFLGGSVESVAEHSEQHDLCLKHAMNGYEIRRCGR